MVRVDLRPVVLKSGRRLQLVTFDGQRPTTRNVPYGRPAEEAVDALLAEPFGNWRVESTATTLQLRVTKSGAAQVHRGPGAAAPGPTDHDRTKDHLIDPADPLFDVIGGGAAKRRQVSQDLLQVVGLGEFTKKFPHHLSGGMKQRVSIARALAVDPQILLMDEPFGALDAQTRSLLQEELLRIWRLYRKTVVFVTHSIDEAIYLSDRIVVMTARPGRIKTVIAVEEERPRDMTSPSMGQMQRRVRAILTEEISRAAALEQADLVAAE